MTTSKDVQSVMTLISIGLLHTLPGLATSLNPLPIGGGPVALGAGLVWWATWFQPWCCKERQMGAQYEASAA